MEPILRFIGGSFLVNLLAFSSVSCPHAHSAPSSKGRQKRHFRWRPASTETPTVSVRSGNQPWQGMDKFEKPANWQIYQMLLVNSQVAALKLLKLWKQFDLPKKTQKNMSEDFIKRRLQVPKNSRLFILNETIFFVSPLKINGWNLKITHLQRNCHQLQTSIVAFKMWFFQGVTITNCWLWEEHLG